MYYRVLTAFFPGRAEALGALSRLVALGVATEDISMIPKQPSHLDDIGLTIRSKASEGAALGAVMGGIVGGTLAALAAGGALIVPGLDAFFAGPLVAALAGAGALGAAGTLLGAALGARLPSTRRATSRMSWKRGERCCRCGAPRRCRAPSRRRSARAAGARSGRHGPGGREEEREEKTTQSRRDAKT
jgi:hypothetical protein